MEVEWQTSDSDGEATSGLVPGSVLCRVRYGVVANGQKDGWYEGRDHGHCRLKPGVVDRRRDPPLHVADTLVFGRLCLDTGRTHYHWSRHVYTRAHRNDTISPRQQSCNLSK